MLDPKRVQIGFAKYITPEAMPNSPQHIEDVRRALYRFAWFRRLRIIEEMKTIIHQPGTSGGGYINGPLYFYGSVGVKTWSEAKQPVWLTITLMKIMKKFDYYAPDWLYGLAYGHKSYPGSLL